MSNIFKVRSAGPNHQVVSVEGSRKGYRRQPCSGCPWVKDNDGDFPAQAFKHSAGVAYDMASHVFACHESGVEGGHTCAGFLLHGADHNLAVRIGRMNGRYRDDVTSGGKVLHESYRAMAIANGVSPTDPSLKECRP